MSGAMTDPYLPLEKELEHTRKCLEIIEENDFGVALLTKSDLILRDADILKRINDSTKCVVQMTITTFDEELCKILEPNVCTSKRRFEVLNEFKKLGIPTIVWLTPILPFINDNVQNIENIINECKKADVKGILTFGIGMTLRYGNREYYYKKLDEHFVNLKKEYMKKYGPAYGLRSPNSASLQKIINKFCKQNNILYSDKQIFDYIKLFNQKNCQLTFY